MNSVTLSYRLYLINNGKSHGEATQWFEAPSFALWPSLLHQSAPLITNQFRALMSLLRSQLS